MLFTFHLAAYCTAFSIKTHYILLQIAKKRVLVAVGLNKNSFCLYVQLNPFLHQNEPSRESIFCGKVDGWWTKRALFMLNFLLKTRQKWLQRIHFFGQWHGKHVCLHPKQILGLLLNDCARPPKTRALTTASASGCGV